MTCSSSRSAASLAASIFSMALWRRSPSRRISRVERSRSPILVLIAATSCCSRAAVVSSEMIVCSLLRTLQSWPIWSDRRSMRSKRCASFSALLSSVASTTSSAVLASTPSDDWTSGRLTPVRRFITTSIWLKRMSESKVALTVSAAMSAKASRRLPAMLRYQGRRAVAAVRVAGCRHFGSSCWSNDSPIRNRGTYYLERFIPSRLRAARAKWPPCRPTPAARLRSRGPVGPAWTIARDRRDRPAA